MGGRRRGEAAAFRIVPDGVAAYRVADVLPDVPPEDRDRLLDGRLLPDGSLPIPYGPLVVRTASGPLLVDPGAGEALAEEWGDPVGRTAVSLAAAGVRPEEVTLVLLTHAHADHVGGLTVERDGIRIPRYPNARHVLSRAEWTFWIEGDHPGRFAAYLATLARLHLGPLRDAGLLELTDGQVQVADDVLAVPAPGHTPGHTAFTIRADGAELVGLGDAVLHEWNFSHPEWCAVTEVDKALAVRTRREILARVAREGTLVHAFHLPALGRVEAVGERFRFVPAGTSGLGPARPKGAGRDQSKRSDIATA